MAVHPNSLANLKKGRTFKTAEEAKENGRKGGIAKKRKADLIKEHAETLLEVLKSEGFNGKTIEENMDDGLITIVVKREPGAVAAYEKIMEYAGKSPLLELKKKEQELKRKELELKKAELELKKAQAAQKSETDTDRAEAAIRARAALWAQVDEEMNRGNVNN